MAHMLVNNSTSGLEYVERAAFYVVFEHLNEYMQRVSAAWKPNDQKFAEITGRTFQETVLDPVEPENFHQGHRPSLITAPMTNYPNCAVMVPRSVKGGGSDDLDHQSRSSMMLIVELMAFTDEAEGIEAVNRKAHRMAEACETLFADHNTLGGIISGIDDPPTINIGAVFTRQAKQGRGKDWYWQGARLEFSLIKDSFGMSLDRNPFFNPTGSTPVTNAHADFGIDQQ